MNIENNSQDPSVLKMSLNVEEAEAMVCVFAERSRTRILSGDNPLGYDEHVLQQMSGTTNAFLNGQPRLLAYVEGALTNYAERTTEEVASIRQVGDLPGFNDMAFQRCDTGLRALKMAREIAADRVARETHFHAKLGMYLDIEGWNGDVPGVS
jgi:hypothetical protein